MDQLIASEDDREILTGGVCSSCRQYLPQDHFPDGSLVCRGCRQTQMKSLYKSAFSGIVREHPLETSEVDVDVGEFLRANAQAITNIIQQGLDEHT